MLLQQQASAHGGFHEQISNCDRKLAADPGNAEIWFQRGRLHYLHGDWKQSLVDLDRAESLAPGQYPVALARGKALMAGGELENAKVALDTFIASSPTVAEAFSSRADLMLLLGEPSAAAADFQRTIALKSKPEPDDYVAWAKACQLADKPRDALQALDEGAAKLGPLGSLTAMAIDIELSIKNYDSAIKRVTSQQAVEPRPEPWMAKRASILAEAGRVEPSRAAWLELRHHLLALPAPQRDSHAMSRLLEQTRMALEAIDANTTASTP